MPSDFHEKPVTYAQAINGETMRIARERQEMEQGQREALADLLKGAEKSGRGELELEEMRKSAETVYKEQQKQLAERQQQRLDDLALRFKGPPSGRER